MLEIGTHLAYTACTVLATSPSCVVTTVDRVPTCMPYVRLLDSKDRKRIVFKHQNSTSFYKGLQKSDVFDVAYIDAEHTFYDVLFDIRHVLPHMVPGGILIVHDAYEREIRNLFRLIRAFNVMSFGCWYDIVQLPTPKKKHIVEDYRSGLNVVRVKKTGRIALFTQRVFFVVLEVIYPKWDKASQIAGTLWTRRAHKT